MTEDEAKIERLTAERDQLAAALRKARGALRDVLAGISEGRVSYGVDLGGSVRRAREALTDPALEVAAAEAAVIEAADQFVANAPRPRPLQNWDDLVLALQALRAAREK